MKINSILLVIGVLCLFTLSCTAPVAEEAPALDLNQIKAEIQAMEDAYAAADNAKDADAVAVFYADDAVSLPNNAPPTVGKAAILERTKAEMAKDTTGATNVYKVQDIWAAGNLVVEVGKSTSTDASGVVTTGKYVAIYEKRDGKYICIRDIWNRDAPQKNN